MTKEQDLLIEFDELGFEPTTLVPNPEETTQQFRNKLKQALTELKQIKEAKPSEAMKLIDSIREYSHSLTMVNYLVMNSDLDIVEQALLKAQEQEKVLEVVIKKNVDTKAIKNYVSMEREKRTNKKAFELYNIFAYSEESKLTEEEFELIKKWAEVWKWKSITLYKNW